LCRAKQRIVDVLKLLLDEHISPKVTIGLRHRHHLITVCSMIEWEGGNFLGQEDSVCLREAAVQDFTLVTYDRRTITPLLKSWAEEGSRRSGVIFVDEKTISPADLGGLVGALSALMKETGELDWTDRVCFLRR
jgi:hypothetical protein